VRGNDSLERGQVSEPDGPSGCRRGPGAAGSAAPGPPGGGARSADHLFTDG